MKNKKMTYILVVVVLVIWGLIIRTVISSVSNGDEVVPVTAAKSAKEPYNDYTLPKDTTHLLLNYRDPFGLVKFKDTAEVRVKSISHKSLAAIPLKPAMNWSFIKYSGYIHNPTSRKLIALVNINGKNIMLSEGETKDQVRLIKNMRDSIKIIFNGQTKFIVKSAAL